jgi:Leucine-rich repeat (LRR) protein
VFTIKLECNFTLTNYNNHGDFYTCNANKLNVTEENVKFTSVEGVHMKNRDNLNLLCFKIDQQNVKKVPSGFVDFFPNLIELFVTASSMELIDRKTFTNASSLEFVSFYNNKLASIPENTFNDLTQLKILSLSNNYLKSLPANLLAQLKKLEEFYMRNSMTNVIKKGFFRNNLELKIIWLNNNNLLAIDSDDFFKMKSLNHISLKANVCIDKDYDEVNKTNLEEVEEKCSNIQKFCPTCELCSAKGKAS